VSDARTVTAEPDAAAHRQLGVDLYNSTWTLLEKPDRTALETDEMIHRAHTSRWHWGKVGGEVKLRAASGCARACTPSSAVRSRRCGTPGVASR